jgi:prevent-host-death family protein
MKSLAEVAMESGESRAIVLKISPETERAQKLNRTRHGAVVERFLISEFKARCIELLKRVHSSGKPIIVTLRGEPLVHVVPATKAGQPRGRLGRKHGGAVSKEIWFILISPKSGRQIGEPSAGYPEHLNRCSATGR